MDIRHFLVKTHAHMPPAQILEDVSEADAMRRLSETIHSIAEIVAHMEFWQNWFIKRCRSEAIAIVQSAALGWPAVSDGEWPALRDRFLAGLNAAASIADDRGRLEQPLNPAIDFPPFASYTVADALVHVAGHNSHHLGQIITLRQLMEKWPPSSGSWTW